MEVRKVPDTQLNIEVSDDGKHVWVDGKEKNIRSSPEGYLRVSIGKHNQWVHRLVARAFIPNPNGWKTVNHKNGDKTDNRVENLEWLSSRANTIDAYERGILKVPHGVSSSTKIVAINLNNRRAYIFDSQMEAERVLGIHQNLRFAMRRKLVTLVMRGAATRY